MKGIAEEKGSTQISFYLTRSAYSPGLVCSERCHINLQDKGIIALTIYKEKNGKKAAVDWQ
jgi:hypothetical protein